MATYRTQIVIKTTDGNPANFITNTWHCAAITDGDASDFTSAVIALHQSLRTYMSPVIATAGHEYKIYNLGDPEPRAPILEGTWTYASATGGTALPSEVAVCLSYQAPKISGVPQARRRGRIYIGPLNTGAATGNAPAAAFITALKNAGETLMDAGIATAGDWNWAVYSKVLGGTADVTNGWVDNAWDTQRRRGVIATSRTTWS